MVAYVERDGYTQLDTGFHIRENKEQFIFLGVKSINAIINRYGLPCFSCFLAALGDHDDLFDLGASTCDASFGFNNRYLLYFWEHTPGKHSALIQPTPECAGGR
jgi:hypothetical protein